MSTKVELVTPERILFSGEADFVVLKTDGGEIMFLPNHSPFIGAVDISLVRIAEAVPEGEPAGSGHEFRAAAHGGFVHVAENTVTILASVAEPAGEIDVERARRALEAADAQIAQGETVETAAHAEGEEATVESSTIKAFLSPDDPEVAKRRAEVRLEAAGALESAGGPATAAH